MDVRWTRVAKYVLLVVGLQVVVALPLVVAIDGVSGLPLDAAVGLAFLGFLPFHLAAFALLAYDASRGARADAGTGEPDSGRSRVGPSRCRLARGVSDLAARKPDYVDALGGDDVLRGGAGSDVMSGDAGADTLSGGGGADGLLTDDPIEGDSAGDDARDVVFGGAGDDFVDAEDGRGLAGDVVGCGPGQDTALADRADRVSSDCEVVR